MNPQSQGTSSSSPTDPPFKRRRGRPRKDETLAQGENMPSSTPAADCTKKNMESAGKTGGVGDEMVGKVVSGVIEGSFDAGYLLKVKVGDSESQLRGVVFLPGKFTPITASNDVAPGEKMYTRTEMPIPVPVISPVTSTEKIDKQPVDLQNPASINQLKGLSSTLHSSLPIVQENQPSYNMISPTDNLPPTSTTIPFPGARQQILETATGNQSTSVVPLTKQNEMLKEFEASITKFPTAIVESTEQSKANLQPVRPVGNIPSCGTVNLELEIQRQVANNEYKPVQVCDGVKISNLEHNQDPGSTEPGILSADPTGTKVWTETESSPKKIELLELAAKNISGDEVSSHLNGTPVNHAPNFAAADSRSALSTALPVSLFEREATPAESKLVAKESSLQRMTETQLFGSHSAPVTSLPVTVFDGEAVPSDHKLATDGPFLARMTEPQFCMSPGVSNNVDCNLKDAIPPTES